MIGLGAVFSFVFALLGAWGLWRWFGLPADERYYNRYFWTMLGVMIGGGIVTILVSFLALRSLRNRVYRDDDADDDDGSVVQW